jgi:hypothetical protein
MRTSAESATQKFPGMKRLFQRYSHLNPLNSRPFGEVPGEAPIHIECFGGTNRGCQRINKLTANAVELSCPIIILSSKIIRARVH